MERAVFRAGIIGAGLMGTLHARTLAALPGVKVVGIASRTVEKARRLAAEVGAEAYDDYRRLLEAPLDAVWVTTPDNAHREAAVAVLEAGKHLFLEKALATRLEDGRAILAAARRNPHLTAMVGYPLRFDPRYRLLRQVVAEEGAGRPVLAWSLRTHFLDEEQLVYDKYRDEYYHPPAWYFSRAEGRGPVFSHASHDYDLLMWFCGPVRSVYAAGDTYLLKRGDVADGFVVSLRLACGAVATVSTPWVTRVEYDMVGVATERLTVVNNNGEVRIKRADEPEQRVQFSDNPMWSDMARHFIACVREGRQPLVTIEDGLRAITVAEAAFRSLYEGREVPVAEVAGEQEGVA